MRIFIKKRLQAFWEMHPGAKSSLDAWYRDATKADWKTPSDIKAVYGNASILPNNRVVFNIKGNDYRLVVKIHYNQQRVYIRFIGTHSEYDKIDSTTI